MKAGKFLRINQSKLELMLARRCKSLHDLRGDLATRTLVKIRSGEDLRPKNVGKLAQLLNCGPADIVEV